MINTLGRYLNASTQAVASGGNILFTNNTFSNCSLGYDNLGGIQFKKSGTYLIFANFLSVATAAGDLAVSMYKNGEVVPGAITGGTAAADGDYLPLGITYILTVKQSCPGEIATITFKPAAATSFNSASVIIEKVC